MAAGKGLVTMAIAETPSIRSALLDPQQLAAELGICKRTLDRWREKRRGPPRVVVGRKIFFRREAVEAWLRANEEKPEPAVARRGRPSITQTGKRVRRRA